VTAVRPNEPVLLPRLQSGLSPQHLLVTFLGDYWTGRPEHIPSAALVAVLTEFGVTAVGARAALSRLSRRGVLEASKEGRRTAYGLTGEASESVVKGSAKIMTFGATQSSWDRYWTVVAFSLPEQQRDVRHLLRSRLRWLGFAPLFDGLWISPRADAVQLVQEMSQLDVISMSVFTTDKIAGRDPISAWDLDELRGEYETFLHRSGAVARRAKSGRITSVDALTERTHLMDTWRTFPTIDPDLPEELLPTNWPRRAAHELFTNLYDTLGPLAELRVRQIFGQHCPELEHLVRHHKAGQL
jgi:phenylacetic acid degradation operon negative regulatory protein